MRFNEYAMMQSHFMITWEVRSAVRQTLQSIDIPTLQRDLLNWYEKNKRDLPWRKDQDPYKIWVSEVMLQQTQVDTVIPYFERFMEKFPTVQDLAEADEQDVLKAWEGLGYYSRARHLQQAARDVVANYGGKVPSDSKALASLKGIGPYTKGAILSIAFGQPEPAVDGNVMRVLARILAIEDDVKKSAVKKMFRSLAQDLIPKEDPGSFNQALMELGALICTPKSPMCMFCPLQQHCQAFANGLEHELPYKSKGKRQKTYHYTVVLIKNPQGQYMIEKRPDRGLLANLWQFPMIPVKLTSLLETEKTIKTLFYSEYGVEIRVKSRRGHFKHVFSHLIWQLQIIEAETGEKGVETSRLRWVSPNELPHYPFPVPHQKMLPYIFS